MMMSKGREKKTSKVNLHLIQSRFTEVLQNIRKRHTAVVETLAQVI